jgi:3-oxoacyl-[acyl-carrier protein] reductase
MRRKSWPRRDRRTGSRGYSGQQRRRQPAVAARCARQRRGEAIELNFTRYRQVTHALFPGMIKRGWGRIINITGKSEPEGLNAAFAAKAAVHAWAKGLSRELGKHGITVNCIPPGRIMSEQTRRHYPEDYRKQFAEEEIPVGYWGEPEDLAALAVFLASPVARYITGAVIPVDGGLRRYQF